MRAKALAPAAFLVLALLLLWPLTLRPNFVPFNPHAAYTDLLISHWPNADYLRASLARFGQVPWWNTELFAGQPFAADPLAGLWYPPGWLLLVLPLPFGFNVLYALHLAWAGWGLYAFLRAEGLAPGPAFLGGLAFAGTPKLLAHLSAGHVSLVWAVAWTPWLLLALRRVRLEGGLRSGALAGASLAVIFLADVRWAFFAAVLGVVWWLSSLPPFAPRRAGGRAGWAALGLAGMFLVLSAVLALPLAQFTLQTNRSQLTLAEAGAYSLPLPYLLGLLMPDPYGFHEYMTYLGLVPLGLAVVGLRRPTVFWAVVVGVAALFSLGPHAFLYPLLFRVLPGLGLLRVPPRAWFMVALGVCVLAAYGAQRLQRGPRVRQRVLLSLLLGLTLLDLVRVSSSLIEARPRPAVTPAAQWLAAQPGLFRVYSPSFSLPPGDGLQHVDGVDPLHLATFADFLEGASGVPVDCYTVTLPPLAPCLQSASSAASVDPALFNAGAVPDAARLGLLNVRYVVADFPLAAPGLTLAQTFGRTHIYENALVRPRAWVETNVAGAWQPAEVIEYSPNRVRVQATGPGQLVLSEALYTGWRAQVDGVATPVGRVEGLLRSVPLGPGAHEVVMIFQPVWLYAGLAISALGLLALGAVWRWAR